jgi:protein-disulfide isomerase
MPARLFEPFFGLIVCLLAPGLRSQAEEPKESAAHTPPTSIQLQIDELKQGQERLLKEVEEIKKLLQERVVRTNLAGQPIAPNVASANIRGEPFRGTNSARIAIIEYSDFDCSFCGKYALNIFPRVDQDYVKPGKVRYFFRDLPEPNDTNSWFKARAARCAGDQGKFWEMHDLLFSAQSATGQEVSALTQMLELDAGRFNECVSSEKYLENIQRSAAGARRMGLFGTPAFLIGTITEDGDFVRVKKVLVGAETYDAIKSVLDDLLAIAPKM